MLCEKTHFVWPESFPLSNTHLRCRLSARQNTRNSSDIFCDIFSRGKFRLARNILFSESMSLALKKINILFLSLFLPNFCTLEAHTLDPYTSSEDTVIFIPLAVGFSIARLAARHAPESRLLSAVFYTNSLLSGAQVVQAKVSDHTVRVEGTVHWDALAAVQKTNHLGRTFTLRTASTGNVLSCFLKVC